jgi:carbamoyltransferase
MVVNTSFNDNEEPIVCTPEDALRCFRKTDLDGLAIGSFWVARSARW